MVNYFGILKNKGFVKGMFIASAFLTLQGNGVCYGTLINEDARPDYNNHRSFSSPSLSENNSNDFKAKEDAIDQKKENTITKNLENIFVRPSVVCCLIPGIIVPVVYSFVSGYVFHANTYGEHLGWKGHLKSLSYGYKRNFGSSRWSFDFRLSVFRGICTLVPDCFFSGMLDKTDEWKEDEGKEIEGFNKYCCWEAYLKNNEYVNFFLSLFSSSFFLFSDDKDLSILPVFCLIFWFIGGFVSLNFNYYFTDDLFITINLVGVLKFVAHLIPEINMEESKKENENEEENEKE